MNKFKLTFLAFVIPDEEAPEFAKLLGRPHDHEGVTVEFLDDEASARTRCFALAESGVVEWITIHRPGGRIDQPPVHNWESGEWRAQVFAPKSWPAPTWERWLDGVAIAPTDDGWRCVRPSRRGPYSFETAEEAARMLEMFYPDGFRADRLDKECLRVRVANFRTHEKAPAWRHA